VTQVSWPDSLLYVGETVTCSSTGWTQPSTLSYSFLGASGQVLQTGSRATYTLTQPDLGQTISCEALASNAGGTDVIQTAPTPVVSPTPKIRVAHVAPSVATRGEALTLVVTLEIPKSLSGTFGICVQPPTAVGRRVCSSTRGRVGGPGSGYIDVRIPIGSHAPLGTSKFTIVGFAGPANVEVKVPLRILP
jgi:hypothetical protein